MELSERSLGWLRYIEGTRQVDHADAVGAAVGLMARRTPAWTERFVAVLDRLIEAGYRRGDAGEADAGEADAGRVGAGEADAGEADAGRVGADAGGFAGAGELLVLLGVRSMIDGDDRWNRPAELERLGLPEDTPTHRALADAAVAAWPDPAGPAPSTAAEWERLLRTGLGLLLHDRRHGGGRHEAAFAPWWSAHGASRPPLGFAAALALAPQAPDAARHIFDERWRTLGWHRPPVLPLAADDEAAIAWLLARHWGLSDDAARLGDAIAASYQPRPEEGRASFAWAPHDAAATAAPDPRLSAWLAAAEATTAGQWGALHDAPLPSQPQVVDTDFPTFALRRAEWQAGFLTLGFAPSREDRSVRTTFRIIGAEPRIWCVSGVNDITMDVTARDVIVRVPVVHGTVEFAPGSY